MSIFHKTLFILLMAFSFTGCKLVNERPECEITAPQNGAEFDIGETITITARASDPDGAIKEVRFLVNGDEIDNDAVKPYDVGWNTSGLPEGIQTIRAIAEDNLGDTISDKITIVLNPVGDPPEAMFTADKTVVESGVVVQFTDQSLNVPESWLWEFGDDSTSTLQDPSHIYTLPGTYDVTLTVSNAFGMDDETKTGYIFINENSGSGHTDTLVDLRDAGRVYQTVKIGDQWWMSENLAYLPAVNPPADGSEDGDGTDPYYYVYGYEGYSVTEAEKTENYKTYGVLYNYVAARDACPAGWHLPTDEEWTILENYLIANGYNYDGTIEGNKLAKALSMEYGWIPSTRDGAPGNSDYPDKRNASGFSALPSGGRSVYGYFYDAGEMAQWSSVKDPAGIWTRHIHYNFNDVGRMGRGEEFGFAVRCLKD
ncbi:MAG: PKD domain-containing protein [Bacteroidales bacterium]|nr:PKD domain-containing protein [Bacteroidales bacterium]